jgi:hypothetical protein
MGIIWQFCAEIINVYVLKIITSWHNKMTQIPTFIGYCSGACEQ